MNDKTITESRILKIIISVLLSREGNNLGSLHKGFTQNYIAAQTMQQHEVANTRWYDPNSLHVTIIDIRVHQY